MKSPLNLILGAGLLVLASVICAAYFYASDTPVGENTAQTAHSDTHANQRTHEDSSSALQSTTAQKKEATPNPTTPRQHREGKLTTSDENIDELRTELDGLKEQLQVLQRELHAFVTNSATLYQPDGVTDDQDTDDKHRTEPFSVEEEQDVAFAHVDAVSENFRSQEADPEWSAEALDAIETAFQSEELAGASVLDMDCRATLCRVEVEHRNPEELMEFELWLPEKLAAVLPRMTLEREELDGRTVTTVYLARDGHTLTLADGEQ